MRWIKQGLIYNYAGEFSWANHSFSKATPFIRKNGDIRVYGGMRDKNGVSRIGFVDLNSNNLKEVIRVGTKPLVDIGLPGTFDDNGVVPTCAFNYKEKTYLYYEGYQLGHHVKFLSYTGLAISEDDGETFKKFSQTPVTERINSELLIRAIHCVIPTKDSLKVWYTAGSKFQKVGASFHPSYNIRFLESSDGFSFPKAGNVVIDIEKDEYRVGKPFVYEKDNCLHMLFSKASQSTPYRIAYAWSKDNVHWHREDFDPLPPSESGWDSLMICYPYVLEINGKWILFYNGNEFGKSGFGYALLDDGN